MRPRPSRERRSSAWRMRVELGAGGVGQPLRLGVAVVAHRAREGGVEAVDAGGVAQREAQDAAGHADRERRGEVAAQLALAGGRDARATRSAAASAMAAPKSVADLAHPERALERRPHARVLAGVGGEHHPPERRPHQVLLGLDGRGGAGAERLARGRVAGDQPPAERRQPRHRLGARAAGRARPRRRPPRGRRTRSPRPAGNRACRRGVGGVDLDLLQQRRHGATVPAGRRLRAGIVSACARVPTAAVAAGSLIGGYVVARETGVRPLGGVVLVAGGAWCTR